MATLTKADIAKALNEKLGFSLPESKDIVEQFFEEICSALENAHPFKLSGFGNFCLRDKTKRPGRNPKTGKEAVITERRVVTFKVGQRLKTMLEELLTPE